MGSSPHSRGTPAKSVLLNILVRIIPAFAGNTSVSRHLERAARDHPRIRGEHYKNWLYSSVKLGSSPHSRGTPHKRAIRISHVRIIPAFAGNTCNGVVCDAGNWDHPRIRGEHCTVTFDAQDSAGSSPHSRGTPLPASQTRCPAGIIPAFAGNTISRLLGGILSRDHPRIRGEH